MSVFKYHAFIYFMRPPLWYGTIGSPDQFSFHNSADHFVLSKCLPYPSLVPPVSPVVSSTLLSSFFHCSVSSIVLCSFILVRVLSSLIPRFLPVGLVVSSSLVSTEYFPSKPWPNLEWPNLERPNLERLNFERPNLERPNIEKGRTSKERTSNGTERRKTERQMGPNVERLNVERPNLEWDRTSKDWTSKRTEHQKTEHRKRIYNSVFIPMTQYLNKNYCKARCTQQWWARVLLKSSRVTLLQLLEKVTRYF